MRDLCCELNKQCLAIVTNKLKDLQLEAKKCNWRDFKRWIEESKYQEKNLLAFSENQKPPTHEKPFNNSHKGKFQKYSKNNKSYNSNNRGNHTYNYNSNKKEDSSTPNFKHSTTPAFLLLL